jgi:hypothetical protein
MYGIKKRSKKQRFFINNLEVRFANKDKGRLLKGKIESFKEKIAGISDRSMNAPFLLFILLTLPYVPFGAL